MVAITGMEETDHQRNSEDFSDTDGEKVSKEIIICIHWLTFLYQADSSVPDGWHST